MVSGFTRFVQFGSSNPLVNPFKYNVTQQLTCKDIKNIFVSTNQKQCISGGKDKNTDKNDLTDVPFRRILFLYSRYHTYWY